MATLLKYIKRYWFHILMQIIFSTLWVGTQLAIPSLMARIIDQGIVQNNFDLVIQSGLWMIGVSILNIIFLLISLLYLTRLTAGVSRDLRHDIFTKVISWSKAARNKFSASTLMTRNINDVKQVSTFLDLSLRKIYTTFITIVGAVIIAFSMDPQLALLMFIIVPIVLMISSFLIRRAIPQYSRIRLALDRINQLFVQNISGIRVIKAFHKADYEEEQFSGATKNAYDANIKAESTMLFLGPAVSLVTNLLILVILWAGAQRVELGNLQIGILVAIIEYVTIALTNVQSLATIIAVIPRSQVSIERIEEVLENEDSLHFPDSPSQALESVDRGIIFENVSLRYPGASLPALENINATFKAGQITALTGATGSGKSTILRLIFRQFDADQGQVLIEGRPIKSLTKEELNAKLTIVPQYNFLFSGTVRENLLAGGIEASDDKLWQVLEISQMANYFRQENGLETMISQSARNLSGGQKQRIAIARALVRDTDYYFFDDAFSALDYNTAQKIYQELGQYLAGKTVILIAHRLGTIRLADQIYILDQGEIVSSGSHEELLASSTYYQELIDSQGESEVG